MRLAALAPEWQRIETLCTIVRGRRSGGQTSDDLLARLEIEQAAVAAARAGDAWSRFGATGLTSLALDILACVVAPEVSHVAAYDYAAICGGTLGSPPDLRLIQALLSLEPDDTEALWDELQAGSPLRAAGLISVEASDSAILLRCSRRLREALLGFGSLAPPHGTIRVDRSAGWDDLVLSSACRAMLEEYCRLIVARETVEREWGGRSRGGPVALFSGPSGTGKTLAASALASAVGWPL
jgi:hypothetical protein